MATSRRGLKERQVLKPIGRSRLRNRDYSDDSENEFSKSEDEGRDEPDRCISDRLRNREKRKKFSSLEDLSELSSKDQHYRTNCEPPRTPYSKLPLKRTSPKLYPNLSEIEKEERVKRRPGGFTPFVLIGFVFMVTLSMIAFGVGVQKFQNASRGKTMVDIRDEMRRGLHSLSKMTQQTKHFWIQILSELEIITEPSPAQPAIILAMVPSDARKTAACLSQRILEIVSSAFEDPKYISFDVFSHMGRNSTVLKHDLDEMLGGLSDSHAVGVYNLEKLLPEAAMIFHAYCDNENAPHKRVFFFLTMEIESSYASLASDKLDSSAYHYLMELWANSLREDDSAAIISRIANAPVAFQPETRGTIQDLCPY